jgi:hydroxymethylpyrimidine pyrophosphatase-like HAD family hydrolase
VIASRAETSGTRCAKESRRQHSRSPLLSMFVTRPDPANDVPTSGHYPLEMSTRRFDMLALDLDGTLLDPKGQVSEANRAAVAAAKVAGMRVIICTGRGLAESAVAVRAIDQRDPVVVVGGAIIACPVTNRTLHRSSIDRSIVERAVGRVLSRGHAALVLKDPVEADYDYLVVRGREMHPLDPVTRWWFSTMNVRVREVRELDEDEHPEHTVRVGACGYSDSLAAMKDELHIDLKGSALIHHFPAVVAPDSARTDGDGRTLDILEVFDRRANKWSAIERLAGEFSISPGRVAAIGDEINDVEMIRGAGLGIAMGNAIPAVRDVASRTTLSNREDGVAHAVDHILSGRW